MAIHLDLCEVLIANPRCGPRWEKKLGGNVFEEGVAN